MNHTQTLAELLSKDGVTKLTVEKQRGFTLSIGGDNKLRGDGKKHTIIIIRHNEEESE
jgi:hypothetical protein